MLTELYRGGGCVGVGRWKGEGTIVAPDVSDLVGRHVVKSWRLSHNS